MRYRVDPVKTTVGLRFVIVLICGARIYRGDTTYTRHGSADAAAKTTGALPKT